MSGTFDIEEVFKTDMRDSSGQSMKIFRVIGVQGTYEHGGVVVTPEQLGFSNILYIGMNPFFGSPTTSVDSPWQLWTNLSISPTNLPGEGIVWRVVVYQANGEEIPGGTPLEFAPELPIFLLVIGA